MQFSPDMERGKSSCHRLREYCSCMGRERREVRQNGHPHARLVAMRAAADSGQHDFVEGLVFEDGRYILMTGKHAENVPAVDDIL